MVLYEGQDELKQQADDGLTELVELLESIDENTPTAALNEISILDSKGGRIYL
jgi:hypothetical protein